MHLWSFLWSNFPSAIREPNHRRFQSLCSCIFSLYSVCPAYIHDSSILQWKNCFLFWAYQHFFFTTSHPRPLNELCPKTMSNVSSSSKPITNQLFLETLTLSQTLCSIARVEKILIFIVFQMLKNLVFFISLYHSKFLSKDVNNQETFALGKAKSFFTGWLFVEGRFENH